MNIDLRRLNLHNDGNIATEGIPKTNVSENLNSKT